jgi:hypothetical protein
MTERYLTNKERKNNPENMPIGPGECESPTRVHITASQREKIKSKNSRKDGGKYEH